MSVNTAITLNRIFSNPAWKLLIVAGLLAFIACFIIKGKKRAIPVIICIVSVLLYIVTAGISGSANHLISQQAGQEPVKISNMDAQEPEPTTQVEAEPVSAEGTVDQEMTTMGIGGPYGEITVGKLDGWSIEVAPVDSGKLSYGHYGLILKPEDAKDGHIEVFCIDGFGVCGTGLETEEITLAGYTAYMGTYDDHDHWDYILIKGEKPEIVAQHTECDSWTDVMWEEALSILDTVRFNEGKTEGGIGQYIPESENDTIAVMMSVSNVTPGGLKIRLWQYDKRDCGGLIYGEGYHLEVLNGDTWEDVPTIIEDWGFNSIGYTIPAEGEADMEINWEWLYGKLAPGTYRITKVLMDSDRNDPSVCVPAYPLTAQFIIAGG
ncbi:MAG: hypothetical protein J6N53_10505 [Lachnospiraceae bacterium]|nr:hypothetical protein [Lachnospiraceae bacterium]